MASTMQAYIQDGTTKKIEGRRFLFYPENSGSGFWLFVHDSLTNIGQLTVSHYKSGKKILDVPQMTRMACLGDDVGAAKMATKALVDRVGAARVRSVLSAAEKE